MTPAGWKGNDCDEARASYTFTDCKTSVCSGEMCCVTDNDSVSDNGVCHVREARNGTVDIYCYSDHGSEEDYVLPVTVNSYGFTGTDTTETFSAPSRVIDVSNNSEFSFLHWNVGGLLSKLRVDDFVSYVSSFDFICFVETFVEDFRSHLFSNYTVYCKPATKLSKQGRRSGGVICLVKNEFAPSVREVSTENDNFLCLLLDKRLFGFDKDVLYVCAYVPPEHSPFYTANGLSNGIELFENCLTELLLREQDVYVLVCGDLNSRTGSVVPDVYTDGMVNNNAFLHNDDNIHRCSQDTVVNNYGRLLLNVCTAFGLYILNGVCNGDTQGHLTYIADSGSSVNDYFMLSDDFFAFVYPYCMMYVSERSESDHMPLELYIEMPRGKTGKDQLEDNCQPNERFIWKQDHAQQFIDLVNSEESQEKLKHATDLIDVDMNGALTLFNDCLKQSAECMKKQWYVNNKNRKNEWFDVECKNARKNVRKLLTKFCKTRDKEDRHVYCKARREYNNLLYKKEKEYKEGLLCKLVNSAHDQQDFWETLRKITPKKVSVHNTISNDEWHQHFKRVLEREHGVADCDIENDFVEQDDLGWLDSAITKEEVLNALKKMKNSKAAGPDGIICELLKYSGDCVVNFLVKYFNALFDNGIYPVQWTESIIFPLFKKGNANDPNNYRGISLCDVSSKIYSSVINTRLQRWIEENNITGEHQAGFKKNYSTIDHMFTLLAAVQKQLANNRKLYVAFIDFEKAFDSISRKLLWPVLMKNGIRGKLYRCVRSMYEDVKARIRNGAKLTEYISCTSGVKQGDVCSPVLFSLFINELALEIIENGKHGATFSPYLVELFILLFADDIVLLSETAIGLQTQLNSLFRSASQLQLKVNMDKSNIMVFRNGGYLASRERWFYGNSQMTVVNTYKYLGIYFSTKLSFHFACQDLVGRAKKALLGILYTLYRLSNHSLELCFRLFDAQIQPIVQYGAEIWGLEKASQDIENVHMFALKKFLGVDLRTPNDLVYGDLGRYPIYLNSYVRCINYWLKLTRMEEHRLPFKAYKMLHNLDEKGKTTWVTNVRKTLCLYGFAFVWNNQGVESVNGFLKCFKQRIIDCRWQEWNDHVQSSERFHFYRSFKVNNYIEPYLLLDISKFIKGALTRLRFGISDIATHSSRYSRTVDSDLLCPLCKTALENEVHFVLCCPVLSDLREQYIPKKFFSYPCSFRLTLLLSSRNEKVLSNLSLYLYKSFKRRSVLVS